MAGLHPAQRGSLQRLSAGRDPARAATACAGASLAAAIAVATARAVEPFDHGIWLVAYLFLVGFAAQLLLARGQVRLDPNPSENALCRQVILWNLGVVAVPLGVIADARAAIVAGGVVLLVALASYAGSLARAGREPAPALRLGYAALLAGMTASVFIGIALGWDRPWL